MDGMKKKDWSRDSKKNLVCDETRTQVEQDHGSSNMVFKYKQIRMAEWEDPELISSHGHTKI